MAEAQHPETIELTLDEAAEVRFALDRALEHEQPGTPEHRLARRVEILLTSRLWPELGDLLDEDEEQRFPMSDELLTAPEVSRRLGIEGPEIYRLIFAGELDGRPDRTGQVKIAASEVERCRLAHTGS